MFGLVLLAQVVVLGQAKTSVDDAPVGWRTAYTQSMNDQLAVLQSAYDLTPQVKEQLASELRRRFNEQWDYDHAVSAQLDKLGDSNDTNEDPFEKLQAIADAMPLNKESVALWLESKLPSDQVSKGRARLEELWHRQEQIQEIHDEDIKERASIPTTFGQEKAESEAAMSPAGAPMPKAPEPMMKPTTFKREPAHPTGQNSMGNQTSAGASPVAKMPEIAPTQFAPVQTVKAPPPAPLPPAPPLDEWDKYTDRISLQFEFTEAQRTKAQAILRDLRNRAGQYRRARASDYETAERLTDAKKKTDRLKELNTPLDSMFDELHQRLDNLASQEQKVKAQAHKTDKGHK